MDQSLGFAPVSPLRAWMQRQLSSCGHHNVEANHTKSMWDVLTFTNLSSPSRPETFWEKVWKNCPELSSVSSTAWEAFVPPPAPFFTNSHTIQGRHGRGGVYVSRPHLWHFYPLSIVTEDLWQITTELMSKVCIWRWRNNHKVSLFHHRSEPGGDDEHSVTWNKVDCD